MNKRILIYSNNAFIFKDFYYPVIKTLLLKNEIFLFQSNYGLENSTLKELKKLKVEHKFDFLIIKNNFLNKLSIKNHLITLQILKKISKKKFDNIFLPTDTEVFTRYILFLFDKKKIFLLHSNILDPAFFIKKFKDDKKNTSIKKLFKFSSYYNFYKLLILKIKKSILNILNRKIFPFFCIGESFESSKFLPFNSFTEGFIKNVILFDDAEKKALKKFNRFFIYKITHPSNYYYSNKKPKNKMMFIVGNTKNYNIYQEEIITKLCIFLMKKKKIQKIYFKLHPRSKNSRKILTKIFYNLSKERLKYKIIKNTKLGEISKNFRLIVSPISNAIRVARYSSQSKIYCLVNCYDENLNENKKILGDNNNINFIEKISDIYKKFNFKTNLKKNQNFKVEILDLINKI